MREQKLLADRATGESERLLLERILNKDLSEY